MIFWSQGLIALLVLWGAYKIDPVSFSICSVVWGLTGFKRLSSHVAFSAGQHVLTIASILFAWQRENSQRCDAWVNQVPSLQPINEAVKNVINSGHN